MSMKPPVNYQNYPTYLWQYVTDKTGTIFQTLGGNLGPNTPWGTRIWRCPPNGKPQLIYFGENCNGTLYVDTINKRLLFLGTDGQRTPYFFVVEGYVYPDDIPAPTVVNINEAQLASVRQSIATTQSMANVAQGTANSAMTASTAARSDVDRLTKQVNALQSQLAAQQSQIDALLTPSQVADLVWQKLKDMNFLYRMAFNVWPAKSPDADIRAYVDDLVALIKKVTK